MSEHAAETAHTDVRSLTTIEYGVRDWSGEIVTMPDWASPADAVQAMHRHGYTGYGIDDVLARTTVTTTTTTGWEAAR